MKTAKVTSKGRITIPKAVRRALGLAPGDRLLFEIDPQGRVRIRLLPWQRLTDLGASLPAGRPFPGKPAVREVVGRRLGERHP